MRVLIASGGTGGHLYPAIVLARELKRRGSEVLFAVKANETGPKDILAGEFPSTPVESAPLERLAPLKNFRSIYLNFLGIFQALKLIRKFKPERTVGFGGYASVPVVLASAASGTPILIHEQNVVPGIANKLCARFARKVAVSFSEALPHFPRDKAVVTGNLIRQEVFQTDGSRAPYPGLAKDRRTLLIFGGSAGAKTINMAILKIIKALKEFSPDLQFIHQTGNPGHTGLLRKAYGEQGFLAVVEDYFPEMSACYFASDLVVARSGASSVSELAATRRPAVLIPYPYAAGDHQMKNAEVLSGIGAARILKESGKMEQDLFRILKDLLSSPEALNNMKENYARFPVNLKEASQKLAEMVLKDVP